MSDVSRLDRYDPQNMHKAYDDWPEMAAEAYARQVPRINLDGITHVAFSGMGGSGIVGDIIAALFSQTSVKITVIKGYILPKTVSSDTLVICCSASGETAETMAVLKAAYSAQARLLGVSSGGMMERYCSDNGIPFVKTLLVHSPRASLPCMLYPVLRVLGGILPLTDDDITSSITEMGRTRDVVSAHNTKTNTAMRLADSINAIPVIYYPHGLMCAATRFKNSLHENSKVHAMAEDIIEACHNNIVAWERDSGVVPIIIRGYGDHEKTHQRWDILKEFFASRGISCLEVASEGRTLLSRIFSLIYTLDYTTIFLAVKYGQDPSVIAPIDFVKTRLG